MRAGGRGRKSVCIRDACRSERVSEVVQGCGVKKKRGREGARGWSIVLCANLNTAGR
jgi:hypothetical protein